MVPETHSPIKKLKNMLNIKQKQSLGGGVFRGSAQISDQLYQSFNYLNSNCTQRAMQRQMNNLGDVSTIREI